MTNLRTIIYSALLAFVIFLLSNCNPQKTDTLIRWENMQSEYVDARNVDIWLPPSYYIEKSKRFPVLYMHDGQNLFNSTNAYAGSEWKVDEWIMKLSDEDKIPEVIVIGIWNTPKRFLEYMPDKPFGMIPDTMQQILIREYNGKPQGDAYLNFIVSELKPAIDKQFRTLSDQSGTYIMGSSMGGLISSYAVCEYPGIFRGAGCLSTHWIGSLEHDSHAVSGAFVSYFSENLPDPENHLYYFDYGTETLDALYEPHQNKIDSVFDKNRYTSGKNFITLKFEGATHNEMSWSERLDKPLIFLLEKQ